MIEKIIDSCARNRFLVFTGVLLLMLAGVYAVKHIPLDAIPDMSDVQVIVFTQWEGRSPNLVEDQITYPIVSPHLAPRRSGRCGAIPSSATRIVYVIFEDGTDIYWARSRVLEYMQQIAGNLPAGRHTRAGARRHRGGLGLPIRAGGQERQARFGGAALLPAMAPALLLASVEGVAEVATVGGFEKQYQVEIDPDRLLGLRISIRKVDRPPSAAPTTTSAGRELERRPRIHRARQGLHQVAGRLRAVVVGSRRPGTPVLVRDIAQFWARRCAAAPATWTAKGKPPAASWWCASARTSCRSSTASRPSSRRSSRRCRKAWRSSPPTTAPTSSVVPSRPSAHAISRRSSWSAGHHHLPAGFRRRGAIVTLPIAVALAFIPMYVMGLTANIMSLAGIAIAIGVAATRPW